MAQGPYDQKREQLCSESAVMENTRSWQYTVVLWLQGEWAVDHQWPECHFTHFHFSHTLDTPSYVYSILFQYPISIFADEKLNI